MRTESLHRTAAAAVFAAALAVFLLTVAPTISFWDSGEFITCARIMGVPHPPGAPLLTLLGRVMSIVPFYDFRGYGFDHIAWRVNLIAVLTAAFTVLLGYLVTAGLIRRMKPWSGKAADDWPGIFAAAVSALVAAFSHQFWENAVETETYMPALCFSMLAIWAALRWEERQEDPGSVRYVFLASYVIGLGIGFHLTVMLAAPAVALIVLLGRPSWFADRTLWTGLASTAGVLLLVRILGGRPVYYPLMAAVALAGPWALLRLSRSTAGRAGGRKVLLAALACLALSAVGYSVYPTVMVRAAKDPAVNEGDPSTWDRYQDYLERTQYDQGNMYSGIFARKADPGYQFGYMFMRYLFRQFPRWGPSPEITFVNPETLTDPADPMAQRTSDTVHAPIFLIILILAGMAVHARRDPARCLPLLGYFLLASVGLVLYLNMDNPEARERGYFFLGAFYIVHVWLGAGLFAVLDGIRRLAVWRGRKAAAVPLTAGAAVLFATMVPGALISDHLDPRFTNYGVHDRSGNLIPLEYGHNILVSCPRDAILFTNGDNDTYPLWYLQEVEGLRRDVRVVNLSILNAPWYIRQLRDGDPPVPIDLTDDFIEDKLCGDTLAAQRTLMWPPQPQEVTLAGMTWNMPPTEVFPTADGKGVGVLSVSAYMTAHIIEVNAWRRPLCFSVSISPGKFIGLDRHMETRGMVFELRKTPADGRYHIATDVLAENLYENFRFTGLDDPDVYTSPETVKLVRNYFVGFADLCDALLREGRKDEAVRAARSGLRIGNPDFNRRVILYGIMLGGGLEEEVNAMMERELERLPVGDIETAIRWGGRFLEYGLNDQAAMIFRMLIERGPENLLAWKGLAAAQYQAGRYGEADDTLEHILERAPGDQEALRLRQMIAAQKNGGE